MGKQIEHNPPNPTGTVVTDITGRCNVRIENPYTCTMDNIVHVGG